MDKVDSKKDTYGDSKIEDYIKNLNPKEVVAYEIAKKQLGSSFNIQKSIGYITYLKNIQ